MACGVLKPNTVCTSATLSPLPFIKALMFAPVAIISIVGAAIGIKITTFLNRIIKTACVSFILHTDGIVLSEDGRNVTLSLLTLSGCLNKRFSVLCAAKLGHYPPAGRNSLTAGNQKHKCMQT
jgi:hypothetical protein